MIKQESIELLKSKLDIVDVIGNYIDIKKSGTGTFKACCPFHAEKTASFTVSSTKQIYHCFGCKASGDAIKFVQEYERLSYPETLEKLATSFGVKLEYSDTQKTPTNVFKRMNDFFLSCFASNQSARDYLLHRGLSLGSIEAFEIGFAPNSKAQIEFAKKSLLSFEELIEAGIFGSENGKLYSRFVDRVTFPIKNQNGVLIGFGGRTLTNHPAKYINSPQTKYFNKSKTFYALDSAREAVIKNGYLVIVEGYMDVLMLHQYGFNNSVAVLGTALTTDHIPTIKKLRCSVVLAFDSDKAGVAAAIKSSFILLQHGIDGGVAIFDNGEDPADMLSLGKVSQIENSFKNPINFGKFLIDQIASRYNLNEPHQKQSAFDEVLLLLKELTPVLQDEYKQYASVVLKINHQLFKIKKTKNTTDYQPLRVLDLAEASIIKTIIEKPHFADILLNRASKVIFTKHQDLITLVLNNNLDDSRLNELHLDSSIRLLEEEEFIADLKKLTLLYLESGKIIFRTNNMVSAAQKSFWLRRLNEMQLDIKSGKFVMIDEELEGIISSSK